MWVVVTADDPTLEFEETLLDKAANVKDLIAKLKI